MPLFGDYCRTLRFSRLNLSGAAIDKKDLRVDDEIATVVVKTRLNGEMYVEEMFLCKLDNNFVIIGFEVVE